MRAIDQSSAGRHARPPLVPAGIHVALCVITVVTWSVPLSGARAEPVLMTAPSTDALVADPFAAEIAEASRRFGMPARWITAVIHAESRGDVRALSPKGAIGLMQIMPETYASLRVRYDLGTDPMVPRDNILAGAAFLRELYDRYGVPGFLAAYNAGPARYEEYLATGRPLPTETRRYVAILTPMVGDEPVDRTVIVAADAFSWTRAPLFIERVVNQPGNNGVASNAQPELPTWRRAAADLSALAPQSDGLFVHRNVGDRRQ